MKEYEVRQNGSKICSLRGMSCNINLECVKCGYVEIYSNKEKFFEVSKKKVLMVKEGENKGMCADLMNTNLSNTMKMCPYQNLLGNCSECNYSTHMLTYLKEKSTCSYHGDLCVRYPSPKMCESCQRFLNKEEVAQTVKFIRWNGIIKISGESHGI